MAVISTCGKPAVERSFAIFSNQAYDVGDAIVFEEFTKKKRERTCPPHPLRKFQGSLGLLTMGAEGLLLPRFARNSIMNTFDSFQDAIIKRADEGICVCQAIPEHPYFRFTVWNDRMVDITGYTMEQINRLGWYQTMYEDPDVRARAAESMSRMHPSEDMIGEEREITRADGQKRLLSISTSVLDPGNGPMHVLALIYDIT